MKHFPKVNEDFCDIEKWPHFSKKLESADGTMPELVKKFRDFYKDAHLAIFDSTIKEIWLEQQLIICGKRRAKRVGNGIWGDLSFGKFIKIAVGTSHRVLTANFCFTPVATYLIDFFPEFLMHDPFKNPEKYKYPYKNVTLAHMIFVYQMDNRLELLAEAERRSMSYAEFINWATNWFLCYNDFHKVQKYQLIGGHLNWPFVRNNNLKKFWENKKFNFNVK